MSKKVDYHNVYQTLEKHVKNRDIDGIDAELQDILQKIIR